MKYALFCFVYIGAFHCISQNQNKIIPAPTNIKMGTTYFTLNNTSKIITDKAFQTEADYLKNIIEQQSSFTIKTIPNDQVYKSFPRSIELKKTKKRVHNEEYNLLIKKNSIELSAPNAIGIMHGIQTIIQLNPSAFQNTEKKNNWQIPSVSVFDYPKFKHRGLLLDCSRHFFSVETIKKYIDLLAFYKMNVLHWHLTEDQGWRIQIDKYPELCKTGAYRKEENGEIYGGFYSKKDIREIVAYASQRHITIIPEIELPGHALAAIASYPFLSCTGEKIEVANDWGVFKDIYCAGNDSVFVFLENVLTEVIELFPSKYIHIGGDEAPKYRWENCGKCQKRMTDNQIEDAHHLQSFFIKKIDSFLNKNERQLIGWDEILEGGLSENACVQSWRGMSGGIDAANKGHEVIMSPTSHAYFDYDLNAIDLKKVYQFDPIPKEIMEEKKKFIIGGECNMWTEHVHNKKELDAKVFPRILAMCEVLWSYPSNRDYEGFYKRVQSHYPILDNKDVFYGEESVPCKINSYFKKGLFCIEAIKSSPDLKLMYSSPIIKNRGIPVLKKETDLMSFFTMKAPNTSYDSEITFQAYKNAKEYGAPIKQEIVFHKGNGKKATYKSKNYSKAYESSNKDHGLLDGRLGSINFRDGNWQGFSKENLSIVIDLDSIQKINEISANFYQYTNSWIFLPKKVRFLISLDGDKFKELGKNKGENDTFKKLQKKRGKFIFSPSTMTPSFGGYKARYVKIEVENIGVVPDWHEAAGSPAWMFVDEIIIK